MPRKNAYHFVRVDNAIYEALNKMRESTEFAYMPTNTFIETVLSQYMKARQGSAVPSSLEISPWIVERIQRLCEKEKEIFSVYVNRILGEYLRQCKEHPGAGNGNGNGDIHPPQDGRPPDAPPGDGTPMGFRPVMINGKEYYPADGYIHAQAHASPGLQRDREIANRILRATQIRTKSRRPPS